MTNRRDGNLKARLIARIPKQLKEKLRKEAKKVEVDISDIVRKILEEALDKK